MITKINITTYNTVYCTILKTEVGSYYTKRTKIYYPNIHFFTIVKINSLDRIPPEDYILVSL